MPLVSLLFHDVYRGEPRESGFDSAAADRYKLSIPEFETQLSGVAHVRSDPPILASRFLLQQVSDTSDTSDIFPYLITVDDGGLSYYTVVADRLERLGWRGHCFVTTDCIGQRGFLTVRQIRELDTRGHIIGSHSASHPTRFSACSIPQMRREWTRSREALQDVLGHPVNVASVPGGYFSAESMFHLRSYASKLALIHLMDHLRSRGHTFLDIQVMTPHMVGLGAKEITRKDFLRRIADAKARLAGVRVFP